jgi:hypothetical protein
LLPAIPADSLPWGYFIDQEKMIPHQSKPSRNLVKALAESENPFLHLVAVKSPHVSQRNLERFASHSHPFVADTAFHRLHLRAFFNRRQGHPAPCDNNSAIAVA